MIKFHKDGTQPHCGEVFVFGSNLAGIHGAGAARAALAYGAVMRVGTGRQGQSYAIPTKDSHIHTLRLSVVVHHINTFLEEARRTPDVHYWMTAIGCGLAGYKHEDIAPLFYPPLDNISYPDVWRPYLINEC